MTICKQCKYHHFVVTGHLSGTNCCFKHPIPEKIDPITGKDLRCILFYERCRKINKGNCPDFEPKPVKKEKHKPRWTDKQEGALRKIMKRFNIGV